MNATSATTHATSTHQRPAHAIVATCTATRPDTRTSASAAPGLIPDTLPATQAPMPRLSRVGATAATSASRPSVMRTTTSPAKSKRVSPNATSASTTSAAPVPAMPLARAASACERIARNHAMTRQPDKRDAHTHAQAQPGGVRQICWADSQRGAHCPHSPAVLFSDLLGHIE